MVPLSPLVAAPHVDHSWSAALRQRAALRPTIDVLRSCGFLLQSAACPAAVIGAGGAIAGPAACARAALAQSSTYAAGETKRLISVDVSNPPTTTVASGRAISR